MNLKIIEKAMVVNNASTLREMVGDNLGMQAYMPYVMAVQKKPPRAM